MSQKAQHDTPTDARSSAFEPATSDGTHSFPCGQCGAELSFSPGLASLQCEYCGHTNEIAPIDESIVELDYRAYLVAEVEQADVVEHTIIKCDACGGEVVPASDRIAFECPFCGSNIVAHERSERFIKPRSVLPFSVTRQRAQDVFRGWIKGLWFAPNPLKRYVSSHDTMAGVYVPYWTFDATTTTAYTGQRGTYSYVTESYWTTLNGKRQRRTRQVRKIRWRSASGVVGNAFDDLLVLASRSLPKKYAEKLDPWDIENLVPYRDAYLSGFAAERYQVPMDDGFAIAHGRMEPIIDGTIRADIGGDVQRIHERRIRHDTITFKHLLLPVWMSAYRYKGRVFRFLINGRTGEVQGERPYSAVKIALAVLAGLVVIGAIVAMIALMRR